jgi:hypothetical protein
VLPIAGPWVRNFSVRSCSIEQSLPSEGKQAQMLSGALTNWLQNRARSVFHCRTVNDAANLSSMIPAHVYEEEQRSLTLLCDIQQELANALNSVGGKQSRGALDNYYFYSADHANRAAEGFTYLRKSGRIDASKLLVRPLIETMFRVEAIQKKPELFYRIAYSETIVEDPKWIGSAASRAGTTFDEAAHSKRFN